MARVIVGANIYLEVAGSPEESFGFRTCTHFEQRKSNNLSMNLRGGTAISRKVVGKSERDNPERYFGWFSVHCFSEKFE